MTTRILTVLAAAFSLNAQPVYDVLLKGGHVVDPKNQISRVMDVAIAGGKIARVAADFPAAFDLVFFAGIAEAAPLLKEIRTRGLQQRFACGDGCWDVKGFIGRAEGAATQGEGVLVLSATPSIGRVLGSTEFAARYQAKYGPIANYAVNS